MNGGRRHEDDCINVGQAESEISNEICKRKISFLPLTLRETLLLRQHVEKAIASLEYPSKGPKTRHYQR